jgi:Tfp pilus tip-associated adhesin PilY1
MKKSRFTLFLDIFLIFGLIFLANTAFASDTCMFEVTADDMPPRIVVLLDNGVAMVHVATHPDYDSSVDYTPVPGGLATNGVDDDGDGDIDEADEDDVVNTNGVAGSGFFREKGYGIYDWGGWSYITRVEENLELDTSLQWWEMLEENAKGSHTWTINGKTLTLPVEASNAADGLGIIDKAGAFRYSKNYLNWLFFYTTAVDLDGDGTVEPVYDGSPLPDKSRLYYAKKALLDVGKLASNKAEFSIFNFTSSDGASQSLPLMMVVDTLGAVPADNTLKSFFVNNVNNMGATIYSSLAEGLATIGGEVGRSSFTKCDSTNYCQKTYVIIVSDGITSDDWVDAEVNSWNPGILADYDADATDGHGVNGSGQGTLTVDGTTHTIVTDFNGSTYLDDVAHYLYTNDMMVDNDDTGGFQNVITYTVGYMATPESRLFLINTANNGNGNPNLSDSSHPEYGKYHFDVMSPDGMSQAILDAVSNIISRTSSFTAPVVPVTRTTSGKNIYMAFFKPMEGNFWEGNVAKFGLSAQNEIIDADGNPATWPNGAIKEDANPFWATKDWADTAKSNGIDNTNRNIYTHLGTYQDLTNPANEFVTANSDLTTLILGNPTDITVNGNTVSGRDKVINFIRGADVLDEDTDGDIGENRWVITGDVLHSEPLVVAYNYADNTAKTMVFFGANDGMLHAVLDQIDPDVDVYGDETIYGAEAWAFIPPDQLNRLRYILEGTDHSYYVDASPKAYFHDVDQDGLVDPADGDKVILVCGERRGGRSFFALDITDPDVPKYMWRIGRKNDSETGILELGNITRKDGGTFQNGDTLTLFDGAGQWLDAAVVVGDESGNVFITYDARTRPFTVGDWVGNLTTRMYEDDLDGKNTPPFAFGEIVSMTNTDPDVIIKELRKSWSEPQFGLVKTTDSDTTGTAVFFIGGGYKPDNSGGNAVIAVNVFSGEVVRKFTPITAATIDLAHTTDTAMNYSVPSTVKLIDENNNGFVDKVYVGDMGGQMWRFGQFTTDSAGNTLTFPVSDENINNWTGLVLFRAPTYVVDSTTYTRKFFYPPNVTIEKDYDMVFVGIGDRESACSTTTGADRIYAVKDIHGSTTLTETDLVDVTDPADTPPDLDDTTGDVDSNGEYDQGWYIRLVDATGAAVGEKVLAQGTVFYKTFYITTFVPNSHPCKPGGAGKLYALNYLTGAAVLTFGYDADADGIEDLTRSVLIGGGIPSKPVMVLTKSGEKILISVGTTDPDPGSQSIEAGIIRVDPLTPKRNFFYIWWRELFI